MERSDWIGLAASLALHLALLLLFGWLKASEPPPRQLGFIEVEFGRFAEGRPVRAVEATAPEATAPEAPEPPPEEEPPPEAPAPAAEAPAPVDLPDQEPPPDAPDEVPPTDEAAVPPEPQPDPPAEEAADPTDADTPTGADSGTPGQGADEDQAAPYSIEGLNRDPVRAPLPRYAEKVNAVIRVRVTVDPQGRIVRRLPLMKGNPALEQAVMEALARWRFNALPPDAPQENQTGTITFAFRLE
jgi:protein TonB